MVPVTDTTTTVIRHQMSSKIGPFGRCVSNVLLLLFSGCALVPGLDSELDKSKDGAPGEIGGYDLVKLDARTLLDLVKGSPARHGVKAISVASDEVAPAHFSDMAAEYVVGRGDVLTIIVWDHPELTSPTGEFRDPESSGRLVGSDGKIFFPYVGELHVSGLTASSIRRLISERLARVVRDPQVDVRVAAFRSQAVRVAGEVVNPSLIPVTDRGLSILEALTISGGYTEEAVRNIVILKRGGQDYEMDLSATTHTGISVSDIQLIQGDVLIVPNSDERNVYVMGSVQEQSAIPLRKRTMSLAEAISLAGGLSETAADSSRIYVVRGEQVINGESRSLEQVRTTIYLVDMSEINSLVLSEKFEVYPRDLIYVDRTGLATYNSVVTQILPTVSTLFQLDRLLN